METRIIRRCDVETPLRERIMWIDVCKGILIFLVVWGHVLGGITNTIVGDASGITRFFFKSIYMFHMPAFFVIAGYLWRGNTNRPFGDVIRKRIRRLIVPYFIWGLLGATILVIGESFASLETTGQGVNCCANLSEYPWYQPILSIFHAGDWPKGYGFRCNSVLWFLPCMFVVVVSYDALWLLFGSKRNEEFDIYILAVSLVMGGVFRFYLPKYLPWGLSRAPYMIIFFALGHAIKRSAVLDRIKCNLVTLVLGWGLYLSLVWLHPDLGFAYVYWKWYLYATFAATLGCVLVLYTAKAVIVDVGRLRLLANAGMLSMGIMLAHKYFVLPLYYIYAKMSGLQEISIILVSMGLSVYVVLLSYLVSKFIAQKASWMIGG